MKLVVGMVVQEYRSLELADRPMPGIAYNTVKKHKVYYDFFWVMILCQLLVFKNLLMI